MLCDKMLVAVWAVGHIAIFSQQLCQRLRADGSMSVSKRRVVKQSTPAVALSVTSPELHLHCVYLPSWYGTS